MKNIIWLTIIAALILGAAVLAFANQNNQGDDDAQGNEGGASLPPPGCCIQ